MAELLQTPRSTLQVAKETRHRHRRAAEPGSRQSHASYTSWISSLASPHVGQHTPIPPLPLPPGIDVHSPASTARTIKLSHIPITRQTAGPETDTKSLGEESKETTTTDEEFKRDSDIVVNKEFGMSTVDEVSEHATSPANTRRGKARSIVDGLVSGLRSLPRAMTHSQLYDRRSFASRTSQVTDNRYTATDMDHDDVRFKFPPAPFPMPYFLAPPFAPMSMTASNPPMSKLGSEYDPEMAESRGGRVGGLLGGLTSLPWISDRVSVDYIPGERARSVPTKTSSSWYTITAPATPSDISNAWKTLPEPWFPPSQLPTTAEEAEEEEHETRDEGEDSADERLREAREELQEKNRQLSDLRQVVEHQKMHISALEGELAELRKAAEVDLHRRRSSVRQTLRARESLRVSAAARRTSIRVSRPSSSLFD